MGDRLRVYKASRTATGATDSFKTDIIKGYIHKVQITNSASSDYRIYTDASDAGTSSIVDEYLVGTSGTPLTVATNTTLYPRTPTQLNDGTATGTHDRYYVTEALQVDVSALTASDTYEIVIYYESPEN